MPQTPDERTFSKLLSPVPESGDTEAEPVADEIGLCLSGGGYRAMLFHLGALWRLNELRYLPKIARISSVSGGSITAGVLGLAWPNLAFDLDGVGQNFADAVVRPLRRMAGTSIDVASVITGALLPGVSIADRVADRYAKVLFKKATLQDLPDAPRFIFCATNVQTGSLMRMSKKRLADWKVGELGSPPTPMATVVAASSAFPPVLSPAEIEIKKGAMQPFSGATLHRPPFTTDLVLSDGGVYDNLGLEQVWKRCRTVLISDGGQKLAPDETPSGDWARHMTRVLGIIDDQVRSLRKRQVIGSYIAGTRAGVYWGIRSDIAKYGVDGALSCPVDRTLRLAETPTRLTKLDDQTQEKLINWGYAVCDAGMRRHVLHGSASTPIFPFPIGVS